MSDDKLRELNNSIERMQQDISMEFSESYHKKNFGGQAYKIVFFISLIFFLLSGYYLLSRTGDSSYIYILNSSVSIPIFFIVVPFLVGIWIVFFRLNVKYGWLFIYGGISLIGASLLVKIAHIISSNILYSSIAFIVLAISILLLIKSCKYDSNN